MLSMNEKEGIVKVRSWIEFKHLVETLKPGAIVYNVEQNGLSPNRELTILRLIFPADSSYYVYIDSPKGDALRETGIPFRKDEKGNRYLEEEDVVKFLKEQFRQINPLICSYWTI